MTKTICYFGGLALVGAFTYYCYNNKKIKTEIENDTNKLINTTIGEENMNKIKDNTTSGLNYTKNKINDVFDHTKDNITSFNKKKN